MPLNGGTALTFAERMQHAGTGTVIGVLTVFAILIILWGVLILLQKIFYHPAKPAKVEKQEATALSEQPAPAPKTDDAQIIAVLTAAVAAMLERQNIGTSFKIKSFRRTKSE